MVLTCLNTGCLLLRGVNFRAWLRYVHMRRALMLPSVAATRMAIFGLGCRPISLSLCAGRLWMLFSACLISGSRCRPARCSKLWNPCLLALWILSLGQLRTGRGYFPDWSVPPPGLEDVFKPLRQQLHAFFMQCKAPSRLRQAVAEHCKDPYKCVRLQRVYAQMWQQWSDSLGHTGSFDWSIAPGQPYAIEPLARLATLLGDKDVTLWEALNLGSRIWILRFAVAIGLAPQPIPTFLWSFCKPSLMRAMSSRCPALRPPVPNGHV
eukprot:s7985_g3.t1